MIGHIKTGTSFGHLIRYVLEDKKLLPEQAAQQWNETRKLQHQGRAEVLAYNLCYGNGKALARQFDEVARLSKRAEKPVFHMSLRLAPGEEVSKDVLEEMGRACAEEFEVADHQYICLLHKDTTEQHIHIVANRVGFDGKAASDSNSYQRMAALCRTLEKRYGLMQVLSPRKFLPAAERKLPRHDSRKEKLKKDIRQALKKCLNYPAFEQQIRAQGYQVIKGRGIAFIDEKKVRIKGSEVGFPLAAIEKTIALQVQLAAKHSNNIAISTHPGLQPRSKGIPDREMIQLRKEIAAMLLGLPKPEHGSGTDSYNPWKRKKKKKWLGLN